jgi:hypothetical protein
VIFCEIFMGRHIANLALRALEDLFAARSPGHSPNMRLRQAGSSWNRPTQSVWLAKAEEWAQRALDEIAFDFRESSGASFTDAEPQMTTKRKRPRLNLRRSAILLHRAPKIQGQPLSCRCYLMEMAA